MDSLTEARHIIDGIDMEMTDLFLRRMKAAEVIAAHKAEYGLPIEDKAREAAIMGKLTAAVPKAYRPYYKAFLTSVITESKRYQTALLTPEKSGTRTLSVKTSQGAYPVYIGRGILREAGRLLPLDRKVLILTDSGVPLECVHTVASVSREPYIMKLSPGEQNKCPDVWLSVLNTLAMHGFGRGDCLVSVGGGVIGDLGGFAAACYMRGIGFCQVPTTLLSQVDSSVGGKTALDLGGFKNAVGAFYPPLAVLIDPEVLHTLNRRQFAAGMAEIIKMAATHDEELFSLLERFSNVLPEDADLMLHIITESLKIKLSVVEADEQEAGLRRVLNFGHTVGHAIETVSAEDNVPFLHGECVGLGMLCVTHGEVRARVARLLELYGLPVSCTCAATSLADAIKHDKKASSGSVCVVRVPEIGSFAFENTTAEALVEESREVLNLL